MNKKERINQEIEKWKNRLFFEYGEEHILNITLYGSQNYNIDTANSDIDVKAIYIPSTKEAILYKNRLSKELHDEKGQHCEIKDIREMCNMYKKQNINFLETLFTEYRWDNPKYADVTDFFQKNKEFIAYMNKDYGIKSICGQALNAIKYYDKNPENQKKYLAKIIYFYIYLKKYTNHLKYEEVLKINDSDTYKDFSARNLLINLKNNNIHQETIEILNNEIEYLTKYFKDMQPSTTLHYPNNIEIALDEVCLYAINKL